MIQGVIFDLDGVLVTTDEMHFRGWKRLAEEEGIPFDRQVNHRQRGIGRMESLEVMLENTSKQYSQAAKLAMAERKNTYYREFLQQLKPEDLLPGALAMLQELRQRGVKIAVGSSSKNTPLIMELTGITNAVDAIIDGNQISASKPDPEVFLKAAAAIGLPAEACVVVEDATAGIEAGQRAGMAILGIGTPETLPNVTPLVPNLAAISVDELLALVPETEIPVKS